MLLDCGGIYSFFFFFLVAKLGGIYSKRHMGCYLICTIFFTCKFKENPSKHLISPIPKDHNFGDSLKGFKYLKHENQK